MKIPHSAHVVVADGRKYLLLRNEGDDALVNLVTEDHDTQDDLPTRDVGSDKPGRTFTGTQAHGAGAPDHRAGYTQTDYHQQSEDDFVSSLVADLSDRVKRKRIEALVVVAAPKALGAMRTAYDKHVAGVVIGEVAKEMTNGTTVEIGEALAAA